MHAGLTSSPGLFASPARGLGRPTSPPHPCEVCESADSTPPIQQCTTKGQIYSCIISKWSLLGLTLETSCAHGRGYSLPLRTRLSPIRTRSVSIVIHGALPLQCLTSLLLARCFSLFFPCQVFLELWKGLECLATPPTFQILFQKRFVSILLQRRHLGTSDGSIPPETDFGVTHKRGIITALSNEALSPSNQDSTSSM